MDDGDRNTKFLHGITSARMRVNWISSIMVDDHLLESREDIECEIMRFYKKLYTGENWKRPWPDGVVFNQLASHKALLIEGSFSEEEIKEAMFGLGEDKARGPDGFPIVFFKKFWDLVQGELL